MSSGGWGSTGEPASTRGISEDPAVVPEPSKQISEAASPGMSCSPSVPDRIIFNRTCRPVHSLVGMPHTGLVLAGAVVRALESCGHALRTEEICSGLGRLAAMQASGAAEPHVLLEAQEKVSALASQNTAGLTGQVCAAGGIYGTAAFICSIHRHFALSV